LKSKYNFSNIIKRFDKAIIYNKNFDLKDTIILTGSPRSGTTWLMEIFQIIPGYTTLFEPINPLYLSKSFEVGFRSRTYLPPGEDWPIGEEHLKKILTSRPLYDFSSFEKRGKKKKLNKIISNYLDQLKPEKLMHNLVGNKLLVKFIRLNRLLPWVANRFQMRNMIFIIRHPCAVVDSQLKTGFCGYHPNKPPYRDIYPTKKNILDEASKIEGLDNSIFKRLNEIKTLEEIIAASWCLDNFVPLSYQKPYPWSTVIYEKLMKDGEREINRLFNEIGEKNVRRSAYKHLRIPSMVIQKGESNIVTKADIQLSKWKKSLSKKQIERILAIVSAFGLDFYTKDLEPDYKKITF
jgi:hypothetical protein